MTHRERSIAALTLKTPDMVPNFELEFQLSEEMFGKRFLSSRDLADKTSAARDRLLKENAENMLEIYRELEYSILPVQYLTEEDMFVTARHIRSLTGNQYLLTAHGDGTFAIPDGNDMYSFAYRTVDDHGGLIKEAEDNANRAIERNKRFSENGIDCLILCSDYCYNSGPFLSPEMFEIYIQPFLYKIIKSARENGQYAIKHTDGNIMPILNQLVECEPHALHSIDPMAGVDIKEVKALVGDKVCLCGNVHCAAIQTGTDEEVTASCEYAMTHGKPSGGYIYCTSNVPFKGMLPERYRLVLDVWRRMRDY